MSAEAELIGLLQIRSEMGRARLAASARELDALRFRLEQLDAARALPPATDPAELALRARYLRGLRHSASALGMRLDDAKRTHQELAAKVSRDIATAEALTVALQQKRARAVKWRADARLADLLSNDVRD